MSISFSDITQLWNYLPTVWEKMSITDRTKIEAIWQAYLDETGEMLRELYQVDLSKSLPYMPAVLAFRYDTYPIIFSGDDQNTVIISGRHNYYVPQWTFSIPTISGVVHDPVIKAQGYDGQVLTEGEHYHIVDYHRLEFFTLSGIEFDPSELYGAVYWVPERFQFNPVLFDLWLPFVGFDDNEIFSYTTTAVHSGGTLNDYYWNANHYKFLAWGLWTKMRIQPTITNLETGIGIAYGLPFAYTSGIASLNGSYLTIPPYTYDLSAGNIAITNGQFVNQFDLLVSGVELWDYINNYDLIASLDTGYGGE